MGGVLVDLGKNVLGVVVPGERERPTGRRGDGADQLSRVLTVDVDRQPCPVCIGVTGGGPGDGEGDGVVGHHPDERMEGHDGAGGQPPQAGVLRVRPVTARVGGPAEELGPERGAGDEHPCFGVGDGDVGVEREPATRPGLADHIQSGQRTGAGGLDRPHATDARREPVGLGEGDERRRGGQLRRDRGRTVRRLEQIVDGAIEDTEPTGRDGAGVVDVQDARHVPAEVGRVSAVRLDGDRVASPGERHGRVEPALHRTAPGVHGGVVRVRLIRLRR